ncbi:MAG: glycosyltransferase family 1 protein, partial [Pseudomonadota bacterium]|nr:glycosyltransferase family 1 protein [Pseudomonadota bacterium]
MRVLSSPRRVMLTTDAVGGVWRYSLELAAGLTAQGARVLLAVMGPEPSPAARAEAAALPGCDVRLTRLPLDWLAENRDDMGRSARV